MPMTKAQAIAELEHIYEILPLIAEAVKEERKPINQYGKTSYFRDMYGQSMGTVNNRKEGIRREIKSGRYPESETARTVVAGILFFGMMAISVAFLVTETYQPFLYFRF